MFLMEPKKEINWKVAADPETACKGLLALSSFWFTAYCHMAVSLNLGSFKRGLGLLETALGLVEGRYGVDPHENDMSVSINSGSFLWVPSDRRALVFWGLYCGF